MGICRKGDAMKSIMNNEKICYICGTPFNIHKHHIFGGVANRKLSEKYGCWIYLCAHHHNMSDEGIHFNKDLDMRVKKECQEVFEQNGSREEFMRIFGKNYL